MRECDGCTLCCTVLFVPEINKQRGTTCQHCNEGCVIHDNRPESCVDFKCAWLQGDLEDEHKPDKVHFLIEKINNAPVVLVMFEKDYTITDEITEILSFYKDKGISVIADNGQGLLPDGVNIDTVRNQIIGYANDVGLMQ